MCILKFIQNRTYYSCFTKILNTNTHQQPLYMFIVYLYGKVVNYLCGNHVFKIFKVRSKGATITVHVNTLLFSIWFKWKLLLICIFVLTVSAL